MSSPRLSTSASEASVTRYRLPERLLRPFGVTGIPNINMTTDALEERIRTQLDHFSKALSSALQNYPNGYITYTRNHTKAGASRIAEAFGGRNVKTRFVGTFNDVEVYRTELVVPPNTHPRHITISIPL